MNTRSRYARTLQEAFGPYTSRDIEDPDRRRAYIEDWIVAAVCIVGLLVLAVLGALGRL